MKTFVDCSYLNYVFLIISLVAAKSGLRQIQISTVSPQIVPFDFGDVPINSGETVSVICAINKGDLPLKISWLLNNQVIYNAAGITTSTVNKKLSTLSIDAVDAAHAGNYSCRVENNAGVSEFTSTLYVNGII